MAFPTLVVTPGSGQTINTLPNAGQATGANSLPVVLASDAPLPAHAVSAVTQTVSATQTSTSTYTVVTGSVMDLALTKGIASYVVQETGGVNWIKFKLQMSMDQTFWYDLTNVRASLADPNGFEIGMGGSGFNSYGGETFVPPGLAVKFLGSFNDDGDGESQFPAWPGRYIRLMLADCMGGTASTAQYDLNIQNSTGGTFTLTINGTPIAAQSYDVLASDLQTALVGVVGVGNVAVSLESADYTILAAGTLANTPVSMTANLSALTGWDPLSSGAPNFVLTTVGCAASTGHGTAQVNGFAY